MSSLWGFRGDADISVQPIRVLNDSAIDDFFAKQVTLKNDGHTVERSDYYTNFLRQKYCEESVGVRDLSFVVLPLGPSC